MNWKNVLVIGAVTLLPFSMLAQANVLNAKTPSDIGKKTAAQIEMDNDGPLNYGYVDDRDVLWSKTVWEVIDLDERVNFPLYYPIDTVDIGSDRRSLYDVLIRNIKNGKIKDIYADSYFTEKREFAALRATMQKIDTTEFGYEQYNAGEHIAPRAPDVNFIDDESMDQEENKVALFWVWYPAARQVLHEAKVFNQRNSAQPISFDMLLNARRFDAVIYKEDNVYGDRAIKDYISDNSLFQLLESKRIKETIRDKEQDMWSY